MINLNAVIERRPRREDAQQEKLEAAIDGDARWDTLMNFHWRKKGEKKSRLHYNVVRSSITFSALHSGNAVGWRSLLVEDVEVQPGTAKSGEVWIYGENFRISAWKFLEDFEIADSTEAEKRELLEVLGDLPRVEKDIELEHDAHIAAEIVRRTAAPKVQILNQSSLP